MKTFLAMVVLGSVVLAGAAVAFRTAAPTTVRRASTVAFASASEFAKSEIASSDVVVFSKTYCPYCTATKQLFSGMKIDAKVIELDKLDNGSEIQSALLDITGQRTVPNVFIKGKHLGGNDATQAAAKNGKLKEMLATQ